MNASSAIPRVQRVFRNRRAGIAWIFMAVWLGMLVCFIGIALRDGGIAQVGFWTWSILGLFWLFGLGALSWAGSQPLLQLELSAGGVLLRERFLWHAQWRRYRVPQLSPPLLESVLDGDGDTQFRCVLPLADGRRIVVAESPDQCEVEATCRQLQASLCALCRGYAAR